MAIYHIQDAAKALNATIFDVYVDDNYEPVIPNEFLDGSILPAYQGDGMAFSKLSPSKIVDAISSGVVLEFKNISDVPKVCSLLLWYLDQISEVPMAEIEKVFPEVKLFIDNIHKSLEKMEPIARQYEHRVAVLEGKPQAKSLFDLLTTRKGLL